MSLAQRVEDFRVRLECVKQVSSRGEKPRNMPEGLWKALNILAASQPPKLGKFRKAILILAIWRLFKAYDYMAGPI